MRKSQRDLRERARGLTTMITENENLMFLHAITCSGCGTCAGICPTNAIEMCRDDLGYYPSLNSSRCIKCGICLNACPSYSVDSIALNEFVFGRIPDDFALGNYINCYVGHSVNRKIRYEAASGGIATTLLIFALEEGTIDGAVVTRMSKDNPLEPEVFIAKTKQGIIEACKSKYCPVAVNMAIRDVLNESGKFAVVGLPCHIQGIRKAEMVNEKLREKMALHIGLFCSHTVNFLGTRFLLERMNIRAEELVSIDYRGRGWPGGMTIQLNDGTERFVPLQFYWDHFFAPFFFTPIHCTLCSDGLNELADISLGDAWLPELTGRSIGESMIVTRTAVGEGLLQESIAKKKVKAKKVSKDELAKSQRAMLSFKKKNLGARISVLRRLRNQIPEMSYLASKHQKHDLITYLGAVLTYINIYISSKKEFRWLLRYFPLKLLRFYGRRVVKLACF